MGRDTTTSGNNDIFFSFSHDGGQTFSTKNISNNTANSEDPQISSQGNNVYVVWQRWYLATMISSLQGVLMVVRHLVNQTT